MISGGHSQGSFRRGAGQQEGEIRNSLGVLAEETQQPWGKEEGGLLCVDEVRGGEATVCG